jgi:hypothetical protein
MYQSNLCSLCIFSLPQKIFGKIDRLKTRGLGGWRTPHNFSKFLNCRGTLVAFPQPRRFRKRNERLLPLVFRSGRTFSMKFRTNGVLSGRQELVEVRMGADVA